MDGTQLAQAFPYVAGLAPDDLRKDILRIGVALHVRSSEDLKVEVKGMPRGIRDQARTEILAICREGLSNAIRYATGQVPSVSLSFGADKFQLTVGLPVEVLSGGARVASAAHRD